ncbi:MAG: hypothetical protein ACRDL4_00600, partial [Thermoleophilaceae bacterium]
SHDLVAGVELDHGVAVSWTSWEGRRSARRFVVAEPQRHHLALACGQLGEPLGRRGGSARE